MAIDDTFDPTLTDEQRRGFPPRHPNSILQARLQARKAAEAPVADPPTTEPPRPTPTVVQPDPALWARLQRPDGTIPGMEDAQATYDPWEPSRRAMAEVEAAVESVDIVEAYRRMSKNRFGDKSIGNKQEGIMISCPFPWHPDPNPAAWITLHGNDKGGMFCCGPCGFQGGDKFTIAAINAGLDLRTYQKGKHSDGTPYWVILLRYMAKMLRGVDYDELVARYEQEQRERLSRIEEHKVVPLHKETVR